jgi:hypothetical protein
MVGKSNLSSWTLVALVNQSFIALTMNLNAPDHQPPVARDVTVIGFASNKMFSDPDGIVAGRLNQRE